MDQAVNCSHSHHAVRENLIPVTKRLVGRDDKTSRFIAVGNKLKQYLGLSITAFNVTQIIQNDESILIELGSRELTARKAGQNYPLHRSMFDEKF